MLVVQEDQEYGELRESRQLFVSLSPQRFISPSLLHRKSSPRTPTVRLRDADALDLVSCSEVVTDTPEGAEQQKRDMRDVQSQ